MRLSKLCFLTTITIILISCNEQKVVSTPEVFIAISPSPQPTKTIPPTLSQVQDNCDRQTVPSNLLPPMPTNTNQERLIASVVENPNYESDVVITDTTGRIIQNITNHPANDGAPKWSPDGEQIAFLSNRNGEVHTWCAGAGDECMYQLFTIKPDGTDLKQITTDWTFHFSWSPDGKQIVFLRAVKSDKSPYPNDPFLYEIYVVNSDGTNLRNLTNHPGFYHKPNWSPNGEKIVYQSGDIAPYPNSINVINNDGTDLHAFSTIEGYDEVIWTLDGESLLFASQPDNFSGNFYSNDIYRLKNDFSKIEKLTSSPDTIKERLSISPDGKWLAYHFQSNSQQLENICDQLRVLNIENKKDYFVFDAKEIEKYIPDQGGIPPVFVAGMSIYSIIWTPSGESLIFKQVYQIPLIGMFNGYFSIRLDGTQIEALDTNIEAFQP